MINITLYIMSREMIKAQHGIPVEEEVEEVKAYDIDEDVSDNELITQVIPSNYNPSTPFLANKDEILKMMTTLLVIKPSIKQFMTRMGISIEDAVNTVHRNGIDDCRGLLQKVTRKIRDTIRYYLVLKYPKRIWRTKAEEFYNQLIQMRYNKKEEIISMNFGIPRLKEILEETKILTSVKKSRKKKESEEAEEIRKIDIMKKLAEERAKKLAEDTAKAEKAFAELMAEESTSKSKVKPPKAPPKAPTKKPITKPIVKKEEGGGGEATAEATTGVVNPFIKFNTELTKYVKDLDNKTYESLVDKNRTITNSMATFTEGEKATIEAPLIRIRGKMIADLNREVIAITVDKSTGLKFEDYVIKHNIYVDMPDGREVSLYNKKTIRENSANSAIEHLYTYIKPDGSTISYNLRNSTLYDLSNTTLEVELKYFIENDISNLPISIGKWTGNKHWIPYYIQEPGGTIKLYNIWSNDMNKWVNDVYNKDVVFVIAYKDGTVYYNLTDDLSSGKFDLHSITKDGKSLIIINPKKFPYTVDLIGGDPFIRLPRDCYKQCYIKN